MAKNFYITTTLPYVNADPHIGFALEIVQADILARFQKIQGTEVFFNTGTDEHGMKLARRAQEEGKDPQAYVDEYAAKFRRLKDILNLFPDLQFIRTTDEHHKLAAQEFWRRCLEAGDIYKKKYKGLYCVGDEAFLKPSEIVDGKCPNHPTLDPIEIEEENYFFRLSKYQDKLVDYLSREDVVIPGWRREEALAFARAGLEDFSISREKERLRWGVPVPDDDSQVMYVWFDALVNYISTLGWPEDRDGNFEKFWVNGKTLQLAGKDQVRFQSIMWQGMLMSAGLPSTQQVFYHGFITSGGHKMSKSIGNVIDPISVVEEYGADALRYYLARHVHPFEDTDVTLEHFKEMYNANLANGLGNLAARIMQLAQTHLSEPVKVEFTTYPKNYTDALLKFEINEAIHEVFRRIQALDQKITLEEPFKVIKNDPEKGKAIITELVRELATIDLLLEPFMPETSKKIIDAILANKKPENLFPRKD